MRQHDFVAAYNWDAIYNDVSERFGGAPVGNVADMVKRCCEIEGMIALLPGAKEGLEQLHDHGFDLVASTNGFYTYQWPVLEALGVADHFSRVLTPDRVGFAKPDPRLFESVSDLRAHVGDMLFHDVLAANMAEVASVWLNGELPQEVLALPLEDRASSEAFLAYHENYWRRAPYRKYHHEVALEACLPTVVVKDVTEAAAFLIARYT